MGERKGGNEWKIKIEHEWKNVGPHIKNFILNMEWKGAKNLSKIIVFKITLYFGPTKIK